MSTPFSARGPLILGAAAVILLAGLLGGWGLGARLSGAVIAEGVVEVETNRQAVQHAEGGIVDAILVHDGDRVAAGDVLMRLDATLLAAEAAAVDAEIVELRARAARLAAERDDAAAPRFPSDLLAAAWPGSLAVDQVDGQARLFEARRAAMQAEDARLQELVRETGNRARAAGAQRDAIAEQSALVAAELADQRQLLGRGLTEASRVSALAREEARLRGETGRLEAEIAALRGQAAGYEIDRLKLVTARREEAIATLRDVTYRDIELAERRRALTERLRRTEVRAPVSGVIHGSVLHVEDTVIAAGETLMFIVPQDRPLVVTARVSAINVDQLYRGQPAALRFTAFDQRRTPEIAGQVVDISADAFTDEASGRAYYRLRIAPDAGMALPDGLALLPGMPVEAHMRTGERSPLSYLAKPLSDYFHRALREG